MLASSWCVTAAIWTMVGFAESEPVAVAAYGDGVGDALRVAVSAAGSDRGVTADEVAAGSGDWRTTAAEGLAYMGADVAAASAPLAFVADLLGAPTGRRAGPSGVGTYSYCGSVLAVGDWLGGVPEAELDGSALSSLTTVLRSESPAAGDWAEGDSVGEGRAVSEPVDGATAIAGLGVAIAAPGWALLRPSEYPNPKKMPQTSTAPKKTPNSDFMPSVISVSVPGLYPSFSSSSTIDLICA
jgi:hypothetical protein